MHLASISATSLILLGVCTSARPADPPAVPANGAQFPDGIERGMSLDAWQMQQRIPKPESWTTTLSTTGTWTITGSTVGNTAPNGEPPGGSAAAQPLRPPPQAETERKPEVRTVSLEDIQDHQVRIIGKLRCPLWTVVTVRGSWYSEESKPQPPVFRVTDVNGKPLARVADFDKIEPESGKGGDETRRTVGQVWELRCFETGGFIGAPDEAYKEIGGPPVQRPPQGFLTKLCYISARLSPVARGDIGGIFAFTAPTRLIGASKSDDVATTSVTKKEAVASDPVSSLTKDENSETTTFRRDGKTILKSILYHSTEPEKRLLLQRVIFHDEVVVDLTDFRGKRAFSIHPNPHVSVGIQQDLSTGALKSVGLMDDSNGIIEAFEVKDSHLTPVSGKQLELDRAVTKDVGELLAPDNVKKSTPEEFGHHVKEVYKKCHTEKSVPQEGSPGNDKPPPQDPSPSK